MIVLKICMDMLVSILCDQSYYRMRKVWNALKMILPVTPVALAKRSYCLEDESSEDLTPQIETFFDKIFLTSDVSTFSDLKIFAFDADILGKQVATHLDTTLGRHITNRFNDGEINIQLLDAVRGHKVYIIKSFQNKDINDGLMELLLAVSCMKKAGAEKVTTIIPFFPYSSVSSALKTNEINEGRDFHTCFAADIVKMLEKLGCDEIITLNSLMSQPKGFVNEATFINIQAPQIAVPYLIHTKIRNPVLIGSKATQNYARSIQRLNNSFKLFGFQCEYGFFNDKQYIGESVADRDVVLYNNLVRTGNSTKKQVKALKQMGARSIYCYGFHGLCSNDLFDQLINSLPIEELIMTNTIFQANENKKIRTISVSKLLAEIISIIHEQRSLSDYRAEREMLKYAYLQKIKSLNSDLQSKMESL